MWRFVCLPDAAAGKRRRSARIHDAVIIDASTAPPHRARMGARHTELSPAHRRALQVRKDRKSRLLCLGFIVPVYPLVLAGVITPDYPLTVSALSGYSGGREDDRPIPRRSPGRKLETPRSYGLTWPISTCRRWLAVAGLSISPCLSLR